MFVKIEVRHLDSSDREALIRLTAYSYTDAPAKIAEYIAEIEASTDGELLGVLADGELAAGLVDWRFDVNVRGTKVPANGIGMVASAPETRRRGLVRELIVAHLKELRDDGVVLSLLYPFQFAFYNRLGWGFGERRLQLKTPPAEFARFGRNTGRVRELLYSEPGVVRCAPGHDVESVAATLNPLYEVEAARWGLSASRPPEDWLRQLVVGSWPVRRHLFVWYSDAGEPEGYVNLSWRETGWQAPLNVREIVATTPEAWRGLFFFLSCHDSQTKTIQINLPFEHTLLELLGDPRADAKLEHGPMVRAVDLADLLRMLTPAEAAGIAGDCLLQVTDELAPWNAGAYRLRAVPGKPLVVEPACAAAGADLSLGIAALSQLAVGSRSLDDLLAFGLAAARPGPGLDLAWRLFAPQRLWHNEFY